MSGHRYNWEKIEAYARDLGLVWMPTWVDRYDSEFEDIGLTDDQFERLMKEYVVAVKHLFTPGNYSYWSRVKLALYFLFR